MQPMSPSRHAGHSLNDVARQLAPHLRIISASRPTPLLRDHNVLAVAHDPGRRAGRCSPWKLSSMPMTSSARS